MKAYSSELVIKEKRSGKIVKDDFGVKTSSSKQEQHKRNEFIEILGKFNFDFVLKLNSKLLIVKI